jgi:hypothetical protein
LKALPIRSGVEIQIGCRVRSGQHAAIYLVDSLGKLQLLKEYSASDRDREIFYPGNGKTRELKGEPGTEMILVIGRTKRPIPKEVDGLWEGETDEASWPALPQNTVVHLGMDRVDLKGERSRELGETRDRSLPQERIKRRLDAMRERLKSNSTFFEGLAFAHD